MLLMFEMGVGLIDCMSGHEDGAPLQDRSSSPPNYEKKNNTWSFKPMSGNGLSLGCGIYSWERPVWGEGPKTSWKGVIGFKKGYMASNEAECEHERMSTGH